MPRLLDLIPSTMRTGQFITAVVVVVGSVLKRLFDFFGAQGLVKGLAHLVEIDERHIFLLGRLPHGFGIIAQRVLDLAVGVKFQAVHGRYKHRVGPVFACIGDETLQGILVRCKRPGTGLLSFWSLCPI